MKRNLLIFFSLVVFSLSFLAGKTYAADAFPPPGRIPCDLGDSKNPEFHSDRPYQASPCGDRPISYWCGNSVVIDLGSVSCKPPFIGADSCQYTGPPITKDIDVNLTDVMLPILGNTQLVKNSQTPSETLDDAAKVNDYVAWYLGGTNYRAEYGDTKNAEADYKNVSFAGPVQKLLPEALQNADRIAAVLNATKSDPYVDEDTGQTVNGSANHNQIVVCTDGGKPVDCYQGNNTPAKGHAYRLNDWNDGSLSLLTTFFNWLGTSIWNYRYPPLPWQFTEGLYYQKAYNEWRGQTCIIIPITNVLVCGTIPVISNPTSWSSLFAYVPLANTTDKKGTHMVTSVVLRAPKAEITSSSYVVLHNPQLYLAHTLEDFTLSDYLKGTYKPAGVDSSVPNDVENNSACRIITSRTNPGDDATFTNPVSHIQVTTTYMVGTIQCDPPEYRCSTIGNPPHEVCKWVQTCKSEVYATIPSVSKTPYADEIFNNTVAGSDSIFRRIYPKTGVGSPISCIADTPAVSPATYTLNPANSSPGLSLIRIIEPDGSSVNSGNPTGANSIAAQLYYPHFGSVLDYFLNGIQTALRPKGYANPTPIDGLYCSNIVCGELPTLPAASGSCALGGISSRVGSIPQSLKDIIEAAAQTYKTPPNLILGVMFGEGLFNPGRFNWTDQNVKNWATCMKIPGCNESGDDNFMGFNGSDFQNITPHIIGDIQALDPTRTTLNQCNLLDSIYAVAWNLHDSADGGGGLPNTCFGIHLSASVPGSCSWNNEQYESAIKIHESGYTSSCLTLEGSCASGGGLAAACPGGDNCETLSSRYSNPSHNACVWDVGHGN